jgi:hypothetical protein
MGTGVATVVGRALSDAQPVVGERGPGYVVKVRLCVPYDEPCRACNGLGYDRTRPRA